MNSTYASLMNNSRLLEFLASAQSGSAQKSSGLSLKAFIISLITSCLLSALEFSVFSWLRPRLKHIYTPRCLNANKGVKGELPPVGLFSWVTAFQATNSLLKIYPLGLDAYFFSRYLQILLRLFIFFAFLNNAILMPVNFVGGLTGTSKNGFDKFSLSNVLPENKGLYVFHFLIAMFEIFVLQFVISEELQSYCSLKRRQLCENEETEILMIDNIPNELYDKKLIGEIFGQLPGGIKDTWFLQESTKLSSLKKQYEKIRDKLEFNECIYLSHIVSEAHESREKLPTLDTFSSQKVKRPMITTPYEFLGFTISIPFFGKKIDAIEYYSEKLSNSYNQLCLLEQELFQLDNTSLHKVMIQFNRNIGAHIANQIALFDKRNMMNRTELILNPSEVVWENFTSKWGIKSSIRCFFARTLAIMVTICWVVPVSAIGMISQFPYMGDQIPILRGFKFLPTFMRDSAAGILPSVALIALTEMVIFFFESMSRCKGKMTGTSCQKDLQKWLFSFFFIHIFLVVTITSGIVMIIETLVTNPISIPALLAVDLPKASTFFHSFFFIRGLMYFGNTLLQPRALYYEYIINKLLRLSPRRISTELKRNRHLSWGILYPMITVFGCIGIVYSVISPLILFFCSLSFLLILTAYHFNLTNVYTNEYDMNGLLYPNAMLQLYTGIYCLELALVGLFMIQGCLVLAMLMISIFLSTILMNTKLKREFINQHLALISKADLETSSEKVQILENSGAISISSFVASKMRLIIPPIPEQSGITKIPQVNISPSKGEKASLLEKFSPKMPEFEIWLPCDALKFNRGEIRRLRNKGFKVSTDDCYIN